MATRTSNNFYVTLSRAVAAAYNAVAISQDLVIDERARDAARASAFGLCRELVAKEIAEQVSSTLWAYVIDGGGELTGDDVRACHEQVLKNNAEVAQMTGKYTS